MSADDFFNALYEVANLNKIPSFYTANLPKYQQVSIEHDQVFSIERNATDITVLVQ